jgi:hypothetical protein
MREREGEEREKKWIFTQAQEQDCEMRHVSFLVSRILGHEVCGQTRSWQGWFGTF